MQHVLVSVCQSILCRCRHSPILCPNYLVAQKPAILGCGYGNTTRYTSQAAISVSVSDIQEHGPGWPEQPFPLLQRIHESFDVIFWGFLLAYLSDQAVVALAPVRWRRDYEVDRL